ncbi:MAG TPA: KOW domain-containing RNA-binding protein [Patescibacteria group bacterium]|nr:KOW domain-containing RNA-binding protein [Patescibacteria group bacterium]
MLGENSLLGRLVMATAGKDNGQAYLIVGCRDSRFVLVADGRGRSVGRPKIKNIKHIKYMTSIAVDVADKLARRQKVTDEEVRRALALMCRPDNPCDAD